MRKMTISVSPRQAAMIDEAVHAGSYASDAEVLQDALSLWEIRQNDRRAEIDRLKQAYDAGLASGAARPVDPIKLVEGFRRRMSNG